MNRVLLHLGCRCARAEAFIAAANEVAESIELIVGDEVVEFFPPSLGDLVDCGCYRLSFYVRGAEYQLDSLDDAAEQIAEVLAGMSRKYAEAAAALQEG